MKHDTKFNRLRTAAMRSLFIVYLTLCPAALQAQVGSDFFDGPSGSWREQAEFGNARFWEVLGRLYFVRDDENSAKSVRYWEPAMLPTTQDWQVELDVTVPDVTSSQGVVTMGIHIENAVDSRDWLNFSANGYGDPPTRSAMAHISTDGTQQGFGYGLVNSAKTMTLRMDYSASTRTIINRCAFGGVASGASFTEISRGFLPWNLSNTAGFKFGISGYARAARVGSLFADNFYFSSPPGTPHMLIAPAVEIAWKSEKGVRYEIVSRAATGTIWQREGIFVGTGTVMRVAYNTRSSPNRIYRLNVLPAL